MMALLAALTPGEEGSTGRVLEHLTDALARPGRTLEIVPGANLLRNRHALNDVTRQFHRVHASSRVVARFKAGMAERGYTRGVGRMESARIEMDGKAA